MRNDIRRAIQAVSKEDAEFKVDAVYETKEEIILISDEIGIPPYIVFKDSMTVRQIEFGNEDDMRIVYRESKKVVDLQ